LWDGAALEERGKSGIGFNRWNEMICGDALLEFGNEMVKWPA